MASPAKTVKVPVQRPVLRCPDGSDSWVPLPCDESGAETLPTSTKGVPLPPLCPSCGLPPTRGSGHKVEMDTITVKEVRSP